ncbi:MAG TPA: hypothetical protein VIX73_25465 [Kofleriaceae bacterium]|jgi:hypothetical protein
MRYAMILVLVLAACDRSAARKKWSPAGKAWAAQFAAMVPEIMCQDAMYFLSCFEITAAECRRVVRDQTESCLDDHADLVPQVLSEESGRLAGTKIGQCAGGATEFAIRARHAARSVPLCSDVNHWARVARETAASFTGQIK